jgi:hypothetical protein
MVMTDELQAARARRRGRVTRRATSCRSCATARSVAAQAEVARLAAESDAVRARESERQAYAVAQKALEAASAARLELERAYALLGSTRCRTDGRRPR